MFLISSLGSIPIWNQIKETSVGVSVLDLNEEVYMIVQRLRNRRIISSYDVFPQYETIICNSVLNRLYEEVLISH